jgi:hypothetical protein
MEKDEKTKMLKERKLFGSRLKLLIIYSWLFGALLLSTVYAFDKLIDHVWTNDLPFGSDQTLLLVLIIFACVVMSFGSMQILKLYYFFKFILEMLIDDCRKMGTILHGLTGGAKIIEVDKLEDIPDYIKNLTGNGPDKDTLH